MVGKQRQFRAAFKFERVLEELGGEKSTAQRGRERQVTDWLVYKWKQAFLEKAAGLVETQQGAARGRDEQGQRQAALARLDGQLTLEKGLLRKGTSWLEAARRRKGQGATPGALQGQSQA